MSIKKLAQPKQNVKPKPEDIAYKLLTLGFSVIPSGGGDSGKLPIVSWKHFQDEPPTEEQFHQWCKDSKPSLWGIVTNKDIGDLDADTKEARAEITAELGEPHIITPRGGAHWYIDTTGHPIKTDTRVLPDVDVRGVGGFANIVGTNPVTGGKYKIVKLPIPDDNLIPYSKLPERILSALNGYSPSKTKKIEPLKPGSRHCAAISIIGKLRSRDFTQPEIDTVALALNAFSEKPLPDAEMLTMARQYEKQGNGHYDWHDHLIEHDAILKKDLPPMAFSVDRLLPRPGVGILASKKKMFKSFMCLQLAASVAPGKPFLGFDTTPGRVVYFALEDGERRLHNRLKMQNAVAGLPITYFHSITPLNTAAGIQELRDIATELTPVLIIIDTLSQAKTGKLDENVAGETADLFNNLRKVALDTNCTVLLVHHHGKAKLLGDMARDAGFDIRGSSAISGATDTNMGIYKNPDGTYDLSVEGRDIAEVDLRLSFDRELTWCWQNEGNAVDLRRSDAETRIIEAIKDLGGGVDASQIANELDLTRGTVQYVVKRMRNDGLLEATTSNKKILYSIPSSTSSTTTTLYNHQHHQQETLPVGPVDDVGDTLPDEEGQE